MNLLKCIIADIGGDYPELNGLELSLPVIPVKGEENFDITHKGEIYNCSIIDIDWIIHETKFNYCVIYIK